MALENKLGITESAELAREEERISKAKALLQYNPEWSFKSGIKEAIEWYKLNL